MGYYYLSYSLFTYQKYRLKASKNLTKSAIFAIFTFIFTLMDLFNGFNGVDLDKFI